MSVRRLSPMEGDDEVLARPVPDGPWMAEVWSIPRPERYATSAAAKCAVETCSMPSGRAVGDRPRPSDVLCIPHRRRLHKQPGAAADLAGFIRQQGVARPICKPRGADTGLDHFPPLDFGRVSRRLAHELRYVIAVKTGRHHWRHPEYVMRIVRGALDAAECYGFNQLSDFPPIPRVNGRNSAAAGTELFPALRSSDSRVLAAALPAMVELVDRWNADPWDVDHWHYADLGLSVGETAGKGTISWDRVTCEWLRLGLKSLARQHLQAGTLTWGTIGTFVRGGSAFSRFLDDEVGQVEPQEVTRTLFLDFVAWMRDEATTPTDLNAVNTLAQKLVELRARGLLPDLPDTTFLLRGENPVRKQLRPKPFPADILNQIDELIGDADALDPDVRLILRICRAVGPRASEVLTLPRSAVQHTEGRGYSLEYFQTKTQEWRRVPIPPQLGEDLVERSQWVAANYGESCPWMFPYFGPGARTSTIRGQEAAAPWPYGRLTATVWHAYRRAGIAKSSVTGEVLKGPQLHRFRHSVATGLLNEGWSTYEVQQFLGHKSPTMMQAYAEIHEDRLRAKYMEFAQKAIDVDGRLTPTTTSAVADVERLRDRMIRTTLPNGYCTLPEKQTCDFAPTPCLSCKPFFRTTPTFLPIHIRQRDEAMRELDVARADGRTRAAEAHEKTVERLNTIIDALDDHTAVAGPSEATRAS